MTAAPRVSISLAAAKGWKQLEGPPQRNGEQTRSIHPVAGDSAVTGKAVLTRATAGVDLEGSGSGRSAGLRSTNTARVPSPRSPEESDPQTQKQLAGAARPGLRLGEMRKVRRQTARPVHNSVDVFNVAGLTLRNGAGQQFDALCVWPQLNKTPSGETEARHEGTSPPLPSSSPSTLLTAQAGHGLTAARMRKDGSLPLPRL